MIPAAIEFMAALEHADATFHPGMPLTTLLKPTLFFMLFASFTLSAWLGQDHPFNALVLGNLLIVSRVNFSVSTHLVGWFSKTLDMMLQTGYPLLGIVWIIFQDLPAGNNAANSFIQPFDWMNWWQGK